MKIVKWTISIILGMVVIALALIYFLPGWDLYIVRSDSMKPEFSSHDMIFTRPVGNNLQTGDIITFQIGTEKITHRIISVNGNSIITKGDANEDPDIQPVSISQVSGVYLFNIPNVGYLTSFISTRNGWFLVIVLPSVLLVIWIVIEIIREALKNDKARGNNRKNI